MRALAAPLTAVLCWVLTVTPVGAGAGNGSYDAEASATPTSTGVVIEVQAWSGGGTVSIGSNPLAECTFVAGLDGPTVIDYAGGRGILLGITDPTMETSEAVYVFVSCPTPVFNGFAWAVWEQTDPPPPAVIDALVRAARASIEVPDLTPRSAPDGLDTPFLTQLPVWLWVAPASWTPVSATAALPEIALSVTATATPLRTDWLAAGANSIAPDTDLRASTTCAAGTPWAEGLSDADTDCTVTFTGTTPPGTTVDLSVTTTYDLTFACTPGLCDPDAIDLPDLAVTVTRPVTVTEARGIIVR